MSNSSQERSVPQGCYKGGADHGRQQSQSIQLYVM